ncbi:MAG: DUF4231 domain-containing protein [Phototrophicaceae bacterium]
MSEIDTTLRTQPPMPPEPDKNQQPKTMGEERVKESRFEWFRQFPSFNFPSEPRKDFVLLKESDVKELLDDYDIGYDTPAAQRVWEDIDVLNEELMPIFRERDHVAKREQNRYRLYQLSFLFLATAATAIGSFQVWALQSAQEMILVFGLFETFIALLTVFVSTLMGNRQPLGEWLENRRLTEQLRREYYRFLTDTEPYDLLDGVDRKKRLARRAAAINNRKDPDSVIN